MMNRKIIRKKFWCHKMKKKTKTKFKYLILEIEAKAEDRLKNKPTYLN